jgi:pimeloyl-ACP methyl ester carboxylesterase
MTGVQNVVLVHGGFVDGSGWQGVYELLKAQGFNVSVVQNQTLSLESDVETTRNVLDLQDGPAILVGHSYGGAVITEAGSHPAVTHLAYLSGLALDDGESCTDAASEEAVAEGISHAGRTELAAGFVTGPGDTVTLDPDVARACLYHDCDPATADWAIARLGPQPLLSLRQQPWAVAWRTKPSTYVVCANDQAIHPVLQRILARRCITAVEWPTGHAPFLSRPDLLAGLLAGLASLPGAGCTG